MDRVIVAFGTEQGRLRVKEMLENTGISPASSTCSGAAVLRAALSMGGGVVVCGPKLRDMSALELASSLPPTGVMLMVAAPAELDLQADDGIFRMALPLSRSDLAASVRLLLQLERQRVRQLLPARSEEEKRLIAEAKQHLMTQRGMTEQAAYRQIQKRSMDRGARLADIALEILNESS